MLDILEGNGYDRNKWFNESDKNIKFEIGENIIIGEIANINNENKVIVYDLNNIDIIKNYYHGEIVLNKKDTLYKI